MNTQPADALSATLYARFRSRRGHMFAKRVLPPMRKGLGSHVKPQAGQP
jgi:6-phosphogluconate dehydrogenase